LLAAPLAAGALLTSGQVESAAGAARDDCPAPPGFSAQRVKVPLDRSGAVKGSVGLCVQRRAATGARQGALVVLAGGPGQAATVAITDDSRARRRFLGLVGAEALRSRDLVVFDQRGTGRSGYLRCLGAPGSDALTATERLPPRARAAGVARDCGRDLGRKRSFFTTPDSVADIEAIRKRLGVPKLALLGVSYGTKVAVAFALRYPGRVERLALDSNLVPEGPDAFMRDSFSAMPRVLREVCGSACASFTPDPAADLRALVGRMATRPLRGVVTGPNGSRERFSMRRSDLLGLLIGGDFDPRIRGDLSGAVRAALDGDPTPLLRLAYGGPEPQSPGGGEEDPAGVPEFSDAVFIAATCEETALPWPRTASPTARRAAARQAAAALPDSDFFPFDRATGLSSQANDLCVDWPAASRVPELGPGPLPSVPALLINGEDDLRTPVEQLQALAVRLPGARPLTVAAVGHSVLARGSRTSQTACAGRALRDFLSDRPTPSRCDGSRPLAPRPPPPLSLAATPAAPGTAGLPGQNLQAVALALDDARRGALAISPQEAQVRGLVLSAGGMRAGFAQTRTRAEGAGTIVLDAIDLERFSYVPGVRITGTLKRRGPALRGRLEIEGSLRGTVSLGADGTLGGRLGGADVSTPLVLPGPSAAAAAAATRAAAAQARGGLSYTLESPYDDAQLSRRRR